MSTINNSQEAIYKVYRSTRDRVPIVSLSELPEARLGSKKKFVGKKAKIEAIFRLSGVLLPQDYTTAQINEYLGSNLFNTPLWHKYKTIFEQVCAEVEIKAEKLEFQYNLKVVFKTDSSAKEDDPRLIYLITSELMGDSLVSYEGMVNPISGLFKMY